MAQFPVALLNARESDLTPGKTLDFGSFEIEMQTQLEEQSKDIWKWFALFGLIVLLAEWFLYNKRLLA